MNNFLDFLGGLVFMVLGSLFAFFWQVNVYPMRMLALTALAILIYWFVLRRTFKSKIGRNRCIALVVTLILVQNPIPLMTIGVCTADSPCARVPGYSAFSDLLQFYFVEYPHFEIEVYSLLLLLPIMYMIIFFILNSMSKSLVKDRERREYRQQSKARKEDAKFEL